MAWLDDRTPYHPKIVGLSAVAFRHWVNALCYCSAHTTRGNLDAAVVALRTAPRVVSELVSAGLWEHNDEGLFVHDWEVHNGRRDEQRVAKRAFDSRRQRLMRDPELRAAVRERDGDRCRYCGRDVNWNDRKSVAGATYDHVDPEGENALANLVVCCRSCNSIKRGRTPSAGGMRLRPAPLPPNHASDQVPDQAPDSDPGSKSDLDQDQELPHACAGARPNDHDQDQEEHQVAGRQASTTDREPGLPAGSDEEEPEPTLAAEEPEPTLPSVADPNGAGPMADDVLAELQAARQRAEEART